MILLDTHIWVWWVDDSQQLTERQVASFVRNLKEGLTSNAFSPVVMGTALVG